MRAIAASAACVGLVLFARTIAAQSYPSRPIMFVIPFAAGGDSDLSGRNVATNAAKYFNNTPIVSVNRAGASGAIAATTVRNAAPDGYTLLVGRIATHAILPALDSKLPYRWNEFTMISMIELNPYVERWTDVFAKLAKDPEWQAGNARIGGVAAIRPPAETEKYVREQFELYDKLVTALGIRQ